MTAMMVSISDASARRLLQPRPASFCPTARPGPVDRFPAVTNDDLAAHFSALTAPSIRRITGLDPNRSKSKPPGQLCIHRALDLRGDGYCVDRYRFLVAGTQEVLSPKAQLDVLRRPPSQPGVNSGVLPNALIRERRNVKCRTIEFKLARKVQVRANLELMRRAVASTIPKHRNRITLQHHPQE